MTDIYADMKQGEAVIRKDEREKVLSEVDRMIETHINHLYPMTFRAKLAPMDIEVLDQLEFIKAKLEEMGGEK